MFSLLLLRRLPRSTLFPYTTLFRSKSDMDLAAKGLGAKEWNNSLKTKLSLLPKKLFRIRMSRNFGMKMRLILILDRKSGSAGMPRPISYAVFCLKKKRGPGRVRVEVVSQRHRSSAVVGRAAASQSR